MERSACTPRAGLVQALAIRPALCLGLGLVVGLGCSSSARMKSGAERPAEEIAVVLGGGASQGPLHFLGTPSAEITILSVDGEEANAAEVSLLAGKHTLEARCFEPTAGIAFEGAVDFEALGGTTYRLLPALYGGRHPVFLLIDPSDSIVADSRGRSEDAEAARIEFPDDAWQLFDWQVSELDEATVRSATYALSEEVWADGAELVDVLETTFASVPSPQLEDVLKDREESLMRNASDETWELLSRTEDTATYRYGGKVSTGPFSKERVEGIGHLRIRGQRLYLMTYEIRDEELGEAEVAEWRRRLEAAEIR